MTDLFKSKKEQVLDFIKSRNYVATNEVIRFGLTIYHTRAGRDARNLASEGKIKRMEDWRKNAIFGRTKEDVWQFVKD